VCTALFFGIFYKRQFIVRLSPPRHLLHSVSTEHNVVHISILSCANHIVGKTQYSSSLHHRNDITWKSTTSENPDRVISSLLHRQPYYPFGARIIFLILAHSIYKMWIIQEPNKLELWNKLHFKEKKRRVYTTFKIFGTYICWINI